MDTTSEEQLFCSFDLHRLFWAFADWMSGLVSRALGGCWPGFFRHLNLMNILKSQFCPTNIGDKKRLAGASWYNHYIRQRRKNTLNWLEVETGMGPPNKMILRNSELQTMFAEWEKDYSKTKTFFPALYFLHLDTLYMLTFTNIRLRMKWYWKHICHWMPIGWLGHWSAHRVVIVQKYTRK